ncbi:MAG: hypothetical protein R2856_08365 [Caldilineaceae bacterium]
MPSERDGGVSGGDTRCHQAFVQFVQRQIDGDVGFGPRRNLALQHVAVDVDKAGQRRERGRVQRRFGRAVFADLGDDAVFDAQRSALEGAVGEDEFEVT